MQIYNFDMELRAALMYLLESIEVFMRTYIGYYHAKSFGPLGYHEESAFENADRFHKFEEDYITGKFHSRLGLVKKKNRFSRMMEYL